ncbi:hypothetical protein IGI04_026010 [Brassica rapa subsp. trilocularis]|uniref:Uncharacterized protein n=1 Tax=Brassica rapa subsp. trilocularis TaxID=1813537 RepID=A0ABQ7KV35_BRACM|nr:hypothetical protein IGI04_026010 [Brassica rapa subsp. trilocularis]
MEELLYVSDPTRLERSIRKERRSPSIDNNTSSSIDTRQPQSTETPSSSADTRPPPSTEATLLSTDIFHPTSIDASPQTSIDTEPRDMVANIILLRDENGDLHDNEGHLCNAAGQKVDAQGADEDQRDIKEMKLMLEKLLKEQQEMTEDLNLHLDSLGKEEKREEDAFLVESSMSMGSSYWCRPTTTSKHRSTSSPERRPTPSDKHQSTPLFGLDKTIRIQSHSDFTARHPHPPTLVCIRPNDVDRQQAERIDRHHLEKIDRQEHGSVDRQEQQRIDRFPSTPYRVRLPNIDAHRLNATQNSSQTSVCLGTTEQISQQTEDATEKEHSTLAETSLVEIDQYQRDGYEHVMEVHATKEEVQREKRVKSRKPFIPKHLRREVNKVELDGFHKRVKRVPKDMSFVDAYYKYRLAFMATVGAVCDLKKNMMCLTNIDERVYYDPVDKTRSKDFISCIELSDDEAHTANSTREPAKPKSASIDNEPSASVDKQLSESIDTKLSASVDTLHISEQAVTEKSKFGGKDQAEEEEEEEKEYRC